MSARWPLKVLIAGFGPFPGVPRNPSGDAARLLGAFRRPALSGMVREVIVLPTHWSALRTLEERIAATAPDAIVLLGVASRRRRFDIEVRAVNEARGVDAARRRMPGRKLASGAGAYLTRAPAAALAHALRSAGLKAGISRDAGRYLCNGAYYAALSRTQAPAVFIHLPGKGTPARPSRRQLAFALSEALLALARAGHPATTVAGN